MNENANPTNQATAHAGQASASENQLTTSTANAPASARRQVVNSTNAASLDSLDQQTRASLEALDRRIAVLRERLQSPGFLANKGLGNEVGFYLFCYDPALELRVRALVAKLVDESRTGVLPCNITEYNLYDTFLGLCEQARILDKIPAMEQRRGLAKLETQLKRAIKVEDFARTMAGERRPSDVAFVTGVGEVYPVMRLHGLFETLQQQGTFQNIPVVAFYPGKYTGQSLSLFGRLSDGNYYRAFDLI